MKFPLMMSGLLAGTFAFGVIEQTEIRAIDKISIYEENPGSVHARLKLLNTTVRNPEDGSTPCQLWIKNRLTLDSALMAMDMQSPVQVAYEPRGDSLSKCRVRAVSVKNGRPVIDPKWELTRKSDRSFHSDSFNQQDVSVDVMDDKTYIAVWAAGDGGGDGQLIQAQRIDKSAEAVDSVFQISTATAPAGRNYHSPMIKVLGNDNFVVAWQEEESGVATKLYYRVFNAALAEIKAETQIAADHTSAYSSSLIALSNGGFGIASILEGDNKLAIHLFDSRGNETHAHISSIHAPVSAQWRAPSMVQKSNGDFLIAFGNDYTQEDSVLLSIFDPDTDTLTDAQTLGGISPVDYKGVKLVLTDQGKPVVAYNSGNNLYVQPLSNSLSPVGEPVLMTAQNFDVTDIQLLSLKGGSVLVGWEDSRGFDNDGYGLFVKRLENDGELSGARIRVNSTRTANQRGLAWVQSADDGDVLALWDSDENGDADIQKTQLGVAQVATKPTTNTRIGKVVARDPDDSPLTYSLSYDAGGRFKIHARNGTVKVLDRSLIDADEVSAYRITVKVSDGASSSTRNFVIKTVD